MTKEDIVKLAVEKKTKFVHISLAVIDGCKNLDSYGEICVWCNECGRFDEGVQNGDQKESEDKE